MTLHTVTSLLIILFVQYAGVLLAVLADLVSGLRRARREEVRCTSRGLRRTVAKLSSYYLALFCKTCRPCQLCGLGAAIENGIRMVRVRGENDPASHLPPLF